LGRSIRVLLVDDYAPFRQFVRSTLEKKPDLQIIGEISDGQGAVQEAQQLQPDLILLDIGLPSLNGIEVARRIRKHSPVSKILFVSENRSWDMAEEALRSGADGYVVKSDAASELLAAVEAILKGKQFVSSSFADHYLIHPTDALTDNQPNRTKVVTVTRRQNVKIAHSHEVGFYSDDGLFLQDVTRFVGAALNAGNAAIVAATESHRNSLLPRLKAYGLDIGAVIEQGRYIAWDAADALATFMLRGNPDPTRFMQAFGDLIMTAAKAAKVENPRVAIFGECVHLLWEQGNAEAAIQMEKLGNQLANKYDVDILCGYSVDRFHRIMDDHIYQRICAEHSAVHSL
jgi:DNA-binding NarL/FixJ family response regulator